MAFPSVTPLSTSEITFRSGTIAARTNDGRPWIRQFHTANKVAGDVHYLMSTSEWADLVEHFEENHSSTWSWSDERELTPLSRTVKYTGRPRRTSIFQGVTLQPGQFFVIVPLIEV